LLTHLHPLLVHLQQLLVDEPVSTVPVQVDYRDYRDVAGVKLPSEWTMTWASRRSVATFTELETKVPIDNARFARPALGAVPARQCERCRRR